MDIKPVNQINFDYNGKHYCLEYTRESVKQMEGAGFNIGDIDDKPATRIEQLWAGAFIANHRRVSATIIRELYGKMKDKEALLKKLAEIRYERNDVDFSRNKFRVRGDTLEIYPAYWSGKAIRVEFSVMR